MTIKSQNQAPFLTVKTLFKTLRTPLGYSLLALLGLSLLLVSLFGSSQPVTATSHDVPNVTSITTSSSAQTLRYGDVITIVVSFDEAITYDSGANSNQDATLTLNTSHSGGSGSATLLGTQSDALTFTYLPNRGEITPGADTEDTADDELLKVVSINLGDDLVTDADDQAANLTIEDTDNLPANNQLSVDARTTTVTVTDPSDLTTVMATRTFSAVDDWDANNDLTDNDYDAASKSYAFEYYFISETALDTLITTKNVDLRNRACATNRTELQIADQDRYSYAEGTDLVVNDQYEGYFICFRSRRPIADYAGANPIFSGVVSALIDNLETDRPTITIVSDTTARTITARDNYTDQETLNPKESTWHRSFIDGSSGQCDKNLAWNSALVYEEGTAVPYWAVNNGQKLCFRSVDLDTTGASYKASELIEVETTAPTITRLEASSATYTEDDVITITLTYSEAVVVAGSPQLVLNLNGAPVAAYLAQPTPTSMTFSYTVVAGDSHPDLDVVSFSLGQATIRDMVGNNLVVDLPNGSNLADTSQVVVDAAGPIIVVTPASDDSSPKKTIMIRADSQDADLDADSWLHKLIGASDTCDASEMASATSAGASVTLASEADNNKRVCFSAADTNQTLSYAVSGLITGIDTTAPSLSVTPASDDSSPKTEIDVSVSSTDTDLDGDSWNHQIIPGDATCDGQTVFTGTASDLQQVTLASEANNGHKVCFRVADSAANIGYGVSGVIDGIDATGPTISVTPASDDSSPKTEIVVSATSTDTDLDGDSWNYQIISADASCDGQTVFTGTASDLQQVTLASEDNNGHKVCFRVADSFGNFAYAVSGVINGIDTTGPMIALIDTDDNNRVRATVTDNLDQAPQFEYAIVEQAEACQAEETVFETYLADSELVLDHQEIACFRATDHLDFVTIATSSAGAEIEIEPPQVTIVLDLADRQISASDNHSAQSVTIWHYLAASSCDEQTDFAQAEDYSEDQLISLSDDDHDSRFCFRSSDRFGNKGYGLSDVISLLPPETEPQAEVLEPEPVVDDQQAPLPTVEQPLEQPLEDDEDEQDEPEEKSNLISWFIILALLILAILLSRSRPDNKKKK